MSLLEEFALFSSDVKLQAMTKQLEAIYRTDAIPSQKQLNSLFRKIAYGDPDFLNTLPEGALERSILIHFQVLDAMQTELRKPLNDQTWMTSICSADIEEALSILDEQRQSLAKVIELP